METDTMTTEPRAWVGCLGCYNAGRLNGGWLTGTEAADNIDQAIPTLNNGHVCGACGSDEQWVFDHEGYGSLISGECSPSTAQERAELLAGVDDADAFLAYVDNVGAQYATVEGFEESYAGQHWTFEDFASELFEDCYDASGWDDLARTYFDLSAWARDLLLGGDYSAISDGAGGVYVFRNH